MQTIRVVVGEHSVNMIEDFLDGEQVTKVDLNDINVVERAFDTDAEITAYILGVIDAENEFYVLSNADYNKLQEKRNGKNRRTPHIQR